MPAAFLAIVHVLFKLVWELTRSPSVSLRLIIIAIQMVSLMAAVTTMAPLALILSGISILLSTLSADVDLPSRFSRRKNF